MSAKNTSLGTPVHPTKDRPTRRGREVREDSQDDGSTVTQSNPPNHGVPTHGPTRFLHEAPPDTAIEDLAELWERWRDDTEQVQLDGWLE